MTTTATTDIHSVAGTFYCLYGGCDASFGKKGAMVQQLPTTMPPHQKTKSKNKDNDTEDDCEDDLFQPYPLGTKAELADAELDYLSASLQMHDDVVGREKDEEETELTPEEQLLLVMMDQIDFDNDEQVYVFLLELSGRPGESPPEQCRPCDSSTTCQFFWQ